MPQDAVHAVTVRERKRTFVKGDFTQVKSPFGYLSIFPQAVPIPIPEGPGNSLVYNKQNRASAKPGANDPEKRDKTAPCPPMRREWMNTSSESSPKHSRKRNSHPRRIQLESTNSPSRRKGSPDRANSPSLVRGGVPPPKTSKDRQSLKSGPKSPKQLSCRRS